MAESTVPRLGPKPKCGPKPCHNQIPNGIVVNPNSQSNITTWVLWRSRFRLQTWSPEDIILKHRDGRRVATRRPSGSGARVQLLHSPTRPRGDPATMEASGMDNAQEIARALAREIDCASRAVALISEMR